MSKHRKHELFITLKVTSEDQLSMLSVFRWMSFDPAEVISKPNVGLTTNLITNQNSVKIIKTVVKVLSSRFVKTLKISMKIIKNIVKMVKKS